MTLNDLYLLSQIIASIAVMFSLVALIISIRQNTKAQRIASVQALTAAIAAINVPAMESPALGAALAATCADWRSASRDERIIAHYVLFSLFKLCELAWRQYQSAALDPGDWEGWRNSLLRFYHSPGVKTGWWPQRRLAYSPAFQEFLSQSAPPQVTAGTTLYDLFEGEPARDGAHGGVRAS
jgi:hypothetical protein